MSESVKKTILSSFVSAIILSGAIFWFVNGTQSGQRTLKTFHSNTSGGIERVVKVYDRDGDLIKTYQGKLDIQENDYGTKVLFDLKGKRHIIYNATVIVDEK